MVIKPTEKSPDMEATLERMFGRTTKIEAGECVTCSASIGDPEKHFKDNLSFKEYRISGMCQKCQDETFGAMEE